MITASYPTPTPTPTITVTPTNTPSITPTLTPTPTVSPAVTCVCYVLYYTESIFPAPYVGTTTYQYVNCAGVLTTQSVSEFIGAVDVCAQEDSVVKTGGDGSGFWEIATNNCCIPPTPTPTPTVTPTVGGLILGLRSNTSVNFGDACGLVLVNNCYIDEGGTSGGWFRVYTNDGVTPFNGNNRYWHLQKQFDTIEVSAQVSTTGYIIGPVALCAP